MTGDINRRRMLRGLLGGAAVTVGLPFFDCLLDTHGEALADGSPIPLRFGTWFWGLGMTAQIYLPKKTGPGFDVPEEIASLKDVRQHLNLYSNFAMPLDGRPNICHFSGWVGLVAGQVPTGRSDMPGTSFDVTIADIIGGATRFRSIQLAASGSLLDSHSYRSAQAVNAPEVSAAEFYTRVFGPEFQDPNADSFTPDPKTMVRKSVLSGVVEDSRDLNRVLGASDRARLDKYFTAIREVEKRLEIQLQKPAPAEACTIPKGGPEGPELMGREVEVVAQRHKLMTDILVLALSCNQTRVFNMLYSESGSVINRKGYERTHHTATHEEMNDLKLGYQVESSWFVRRAMESWAYFVKVLADYREGNATLLDRSLVFAYTDQALARIHSINGIPMWTAGRAGGRVKTGIHIDGHGAPASQVPLTCMQALGLKATEFGTLSLAAHGAVSEVMA